MILQITTPQMELWRIDGPFSNDLHMHEDEFQITVPMYGTCTFTQENRYYKLEDGGGLVQHPRERHVFEIGGQSGVIIFKVRQAGLKSFASQDSLELDLRQQFDRTSLAGKWRQWIVSQSSYDPEDQLAKEEIESQVLGYLCGTLSGSHTLYGTVPSNSRHAAPLQGTDSFMAQVLEYMHAHYKEPLTIEALASIAKQSRFHFIRAYKESVGVSPYQYVLRLRIEEGKRLLSTTKRSVTEIGMSLGFSSGSAYSRAFMKSVGVSPEQFRYSARI